MREIKFRYIFKDIKENGITLITQFWNLSDIEINDIIYDNQILIARSQYTGLKDKNGVEIYEGDIIKKEKDIVVIKYSEYHTSFQVYYNISMSSKTSLYEFGYSKELEIIGNIYENPELLKEKR